MVPEEPRLVGAVEGSRIAMTPVAVIGSKGMLGHDLMKVLADKSARGFSRPELDVTNRSAVRDAIQGFKTVINASAYTRVDDAEIHQEEAFAVNSEGAHNIALACRHHGSRLIHVSTDYVFDGGSATPFSEDHPKRPQSVYGRSKAEGEEKALHANPNHTMILRTAWLYGAHGPNFVKTILNVARQSETVSVVTDQVGQPTWSQDLAFMIRTLIESDVQSGIFHGTNAGQASWWDFAREIFSRASLETSRVLPTTSAEMVRPAQRPAWSVLGHDNWVNNGLPLPRTWQAAFEEAWEQVFSQAPHDDG